MPALRLLPRRRSRVLRRQSPEDSSRAAGSRWRSAPTIFMLMTTWMSGRERLLAERWREALPLETFLADAEARPAAARAGHRRVHGRPTTDIVPPALLHNLKHNKVLHERVVLMKVETEDIPHVPDDRAHRDARISTTISTPSRCATASWTSPTFRAPWRSSALMQFRFNLLETSFFVGREKVVIGQPLAVLGLAQAAFHLHAPHDAERDRIFPHPLEPRGRARRPDRDLALRRPRGRTCAPRQARAAS